MIIKLGLRNVLRNKRRSFLSALAIGIGLASLIFTDGFMIGMRESIVKTVTESFLGQAQIHATGYRENPEVENTIKHLDDVKKKLDQLDDIKAWTTRVSSMGMISAPSNVVNVQMIGIDKIKEKKISRIQDILIEGEYLDGPQDILLGSRLAKKLDIRLNEKIVITVPQASSDELSQELFRVSGIFKFGSKERDSVMAFVLDSKLASMVQTKNEAHEIIIKFENLEISENKLLPIWKELQFSGNQTENWPELVPGIMAALLMTDQSMGIIAALLFVIVVIGILNTLFMSIFERMFEFGVLQAIGTRSFMIFKMITVEALWLGLFSIIVGVMVSLLVMVLVNINGIDYGGVEMGEITMTEPIYSIITFKQFVYYPFLLLIFTIIAAIYPAFHATKITLAEAMKKSL